MTPLVATEDYYEILEVYPTATCDAIRKSYKRLALIRHPDRNKIPEATAAFQLLGKAWETLKDQRKRSAYDVTYQKARESQKTSKEPRPGGSQQNHTPPPPATMPGTRPPNTTPGQKWNSKDSEGAGRRGTSKQREAQEAHEKGEKGRTEIARRIYHKRLKKFDRLQRRREISIRKLREEIGKLKKDLMILENYEALHSHSEAAAGQTAAIHLARQQWAYKSDTLQRHGEEAQRLCDETVAEMEDFVHEHKTECTIRASDELDILNGLDETTSQMRPDFARRKYDYWDSLLRASAQVNPHDTRDQKRRRSKRDPLRFVGEDPKISCQHRGFFGGPDCWDAVEARKKSSCGWCSKHAGLLDGTPSQCCNCGIILCQRCRNDLGIFEAYTLSLVT